MRRFCLRDLFLLAESNQIQLGFDNLISHGVTDQFAHGVQLQLAHDIARCVSAVFTLMQSDDATSLLLFPSASNCTISRSREVSRSRNDVGSSERIRPSLKFVSITSVARGVRNGL